MLKMGNFCLRPFDGFCARLTTFCARFAHDLSPCFSPKYELWPQTRPKVKPVTFVTGRLPKAKAEVSKGYWDPFWDVIWTAHES